MKISPLVVCLLLVAGAWAAASQNQQSAPPLKDQSAYPSATHKMTPAEKSNTPEAHGQPVDLNSGSKKDLGGASWGWARSRAKHHRGTPF